MREEGNEREAEEGGRDRGRGRGKEGERERRAEGLNYTNIPITPITERGARLSISSVITRF